MRCATKVIGPMAVLVLLASASCSSGTSATTPAASAQTVSRPAPTRVAIAASTALNCRHHIAAHPPGADQRVVLGVVALSASTRAVALQIARDNTQPATVRYFAKDGLIVRAGTAFELVVPTEAAEQLAIRWGGEALTWTRKLTVSCPKDVSSSGWLVYVGGYWLPRPACVPLLVRADGKEQRVLIGAGKPCPGQRPPVEPSDS